MAIANPIIAINIDTPVSKSTQPLNEYRNLFLKQTRKGWLQNCLGCENKVGIVINIIIIITTDIESFQNRNENCYDRE